MNVGPSGPFSTFDVGPSGGASVGVLAELWLASVVSVTFLDRDTSNVMTHR